MAKPQKNPDNRGSILDDDVDLAALLADSSGPTKTDDADDNLKTPTLPLSLIDPDPKNLRKDMNQKELEGMAKTMKRFGLIIPIGVKVHPDNPERYMVIHGHRRREACLMAGLTEIPVTFDDKVDPATARFKMVIENLQRADLSSFEYAYFIKERLDEGMSKTEIADHCGKSPAWVTQHSMLLDLPEHIEQAYRDGIIRDLSSLGIILKTAKKHSEEVKSLLAKKKELTRTEIEAFRDRLEGKLSQEISEPTPQPDNSAADGVPKARLAGSDDSDGHKTDDGVLTSPPHSDDDSALTSHPNDTTDTETTDSGVLAPPPDTSPKLGGESSEDGVLIPPTDNSTDDDAITQQTSQRGESTPESKTAQNANNISLRLIGMLSGDRVQILLDRAPSSPKHVWVTNTKSNDPFESKIQDITLVEVEL